MTIATSPVRTRPHMPPSVRDEVERLALPEARLFGTGRQAVTEGFRVEVEG